MTLPLLLLLDALKLPLLSACPLHATTQQADPLAWSLLLVCPQLLTQQPKRPPSLSGLLVCPVTLLLLLGRLLTPALLLALLLACLPALPLLPACPLILPLLLQLARLLMLALYCPWMLAKVAQVLVADGRAAAAALLALCPPSAACWLPAAPQGCCVAAQCRMLAASQLVMVSALLQVPPAQCSRRCHG